MFRHRMMPLVVCVKWVRVVRVGSLSCVENCLHGGGESAGFSDKRRWKERMVTNCNVTSDAAVRRGMTWGRQMSNDVQLKSRFTAQASAISDYSFGDGMRGYPPAAVTVEMHDIRKFPIRYYSICQQVHSRQSQLHSLLDRKVDTHFAIPQRVEGWVALGTAIDYLPNLCAKGQISFVQNFT